MLMKMKKNLRPVSNFFVSDMRFIPSPHLILKMWNQLEVMRYSRNSVFNWRKFSSFKHLSSKVACFSYEFLRGFFFGHFFSFLFCLLLKWLNIETWRDKKIEKENLAFFFEILWSFIYLKFQEVLFFILFNFLLVFLFIFFP